MGRVFSLDLRSGAEGPVGGMGVAATILLVCLVIVDVVN